MTEQVRSTPGNLSSSFPATSNHDEYGEVRDMLKKTSEVQPDENSRLVVVPRTITLLNGISFIVGSIIGSGIFVSPGGVASASGSVGLTMISWVIGGLISMLGALCYAELGTIIKESGADYTYLFVAYGSVVSYIYSWVNNLLVLPAGLTVVAMTCAQYALALLFDDECGDPPTLTVKLLAALILILQASINVYSSKLTARIQIVFTTAKLAGLATIIVGGLVMLVQGNTTYLSSGFVNTQTNPGTIIIGFYSALWAYSGWNTMNYITEEIINPSRNLPLSIFISLPLVMIVYLLTNIAYFTVLSVDELVSSQSVAVTWAEKVMPGAVWLIPIFVVLSTFGMGNGWLFAGCRGMFAAARNEHLPGVLAMVHLETCTPVPAVILTTILATLFLIPGNIGTLIDFMGFLAWIFYSMNFMAVIVFRYHSKFKDLHRPIKLPLIIPVLAFLASVALVIVPIVYDPQVEFLYAAILIAIGFIFWLPFVHLKLNLVFMDKLTTLLQVFMRVLRPKMSLE